MQIFLCICTTLKCAICIHSNTYDVSLLQVNLLLLMFYTKTRPEDLVMPDPFECVFSQNLDDFKHYKNQVELGYKGHPIEFMVDFFRPFRIIENHLRPY